MGFFASVAGRNNNGQFCKSQQLFGLDKQLSTSNLIFNKTILIGIGSRQTEY
jgi:hypothetical protein